MDTFLGEKKEKKKINTVLFAGVLAGILFIAGAIWLISTIPPAESHSQDLLQGAFFEGSTEFDEYTKQIVVTTNTDRLMQSLTGMGKITMHVGGSVYNKGDRTLNALEVTVGVVDSESKVIKDKKFILLPNSEHDTLEPGKSMSVNVNIGGFTRDDDRANVRWKVTAIKFQVP